MVKHLTIDFMAFCFVSFTAFVSDSCYQHVGNFGVKTIEGWRLLRDFELSFMRMRCRTQILLFFALFIAGFPGRSQQYGDVEFYLLDSVDIEALSPADGHLLDTALHIYHTPGLHDTIRVQCLLELAAGIENDRLWPRYNDLAHSSALEGLYAIDIDPAVIRAYELSLADAISNRGVSEVDPYKALSLYYKAKRIRDRYGAPTDLVNIGNAWGEIGESDSSIRYYELAIERDGESPEVLNGLAVEFVHKGMFARGMDYLSRALQLHRSSGNISGEVITMLNIAWVLEEHHLFDLSMDYYVNAYTLAIEHGLYKLAAYASLNRVQAIYREKGTSEDLKIALEGAIQLAVQSGEKESEATGYMIMAEILADTDPEKSISMYNRSLRIALEKNLPSVQSRALLSISQYFMTIEEWNKALRRLHQAKGQLREKEDLKQQQRLFEGYYQTHRALGNEDSALFYLELSKAIQDSVFNLENRRRAIDWKLKSDYAAQSIQDSLNYLHRVEEIENEQRLEKVELEQANQRMLLLLLAASLVIVALGSAGLIVRARNKRKLAQIESRQKEDVINAMVQAEEEERARIARELHDSIGSGLLAVRLKMNTGKLDEATGLLMETHKEVRSMSHKLIPPDIEEDELSYTFRAYLDSIQSDASFSLDFSATGYFSTIPVSWKITLYRILQEALTNVIKYAQADHVTVQLLFDGEEIVLLIEDDGVGFDVSEKANGIGMNNIRSRVADLQGNVEINSAPGRGTTIMVQLSV